MAADFHFSSVLWKRPTRPIPPSTLSGLPIGITLYTSSSLVLSEINAGPESALVRACVCVCVFLFFYFLPLPPPRMLGPVQRPVNRTFPQRWPGDGGGGGGGCGGDNKRAPPLTPWTTKAMDWHGYTENGKVKGETANVPPSLPPAPDLI